MRRRMDGEGLFGATGEVAVGRIEGRLTLFLERGLGGVETTVRDSLISRN